MTITYIIPVFNERRTVKKSIEEIIELPQDKEIIIIDNGSDDGSQEIINEFSNIENIKIIIKEKNLGFGDSIQKGFDSAKGTYIYIQYSDLEYDHLSSVKMYDLAIKNNYDVIFGSRLLNNNNLLRLLINKPSYLATIICTFLINIFYKKNLTDIIGTKLYKKDIVKSILPKTKGPGFDFELVSLICKKKLLIKEIFVDYTPRERSEEKKIKFYHMFNALYEIFKVKFF
tara:strand:+ start:1192 stop:1878 length:687 start_codon:yes stop_codon:yes gene_type:complete